MKLNSVVKAFRLLETLGRTDEPQQLRDIAEATGLPKPSAHHILKTLTELGYVERMDSAAYRRTSKIELLAMNGGDRRLTEAAEPILQELHRESGETVNLAVLRRRDLVYLRVIECVHPLRRVVSDATSCSFHCTALGLAQAAFLPEDERDDLLDSHPLDPVTPGTVTDPDQLRQVLERVKRDGYAREWEQYEVGLMCIAAPVFQHGAVCAGVSISAPTARADKAVEKQWIREISAAAEQLTRTLDAG